MFEKFEHGKIDKKVVIGTVLVVGGVIAGILAYRYMKRRE